MLGDLFAAQTVSDLGKRFSTGRMLDISRACNVLKHAISEVSYFPDQPLRSKIENVGPVSSRTSNSIMMDNEGASTVETTRVFARVD